MAAVAVRRPLGTPRRLPPGAADAGGHATPGRQGDAHANDAAPRQRGRLLTYAGIYRERRIAELQRQLETLGEDADFAAEGARLAALAAEKPQTRPELLAALGRAKLRIEDRRPWLVWYGLAAYAGLVNGPSSTTWRANTAGGTFVPASAWLGRDPAGGDAGAAHLVRRYLGAFGPASRRDIGQWTGLPLSILDAGLERLVLRRFEDELGRELLDLPRAPLPAPDTPAPPRFLPRWDNLLLAHDVRTRVFADEQRPVVVQRNGDIDETFLVDGFVAGQWSLEGGRVRLRPFAPLPRVARRDVEDEARRLEAFLRASGHAT